MGEEEFDDTAMDDLPVDDDSRQLSGAVDLLSDVVTSRKRRLLEERLAQRQLERQIQDFDFELA